MLHCQSLDPQLEPLRCLLIREVGLRLLNVQQVLQYGRYLPSVFRRQRLRHFHVELERRLNA